MTFRKKGYHIIGVLVTTRAIVRFSANKIKTKKSCPDSLEYPTADNQLYVPVFS